jgi:hypothetical protein
LNEKIEQAQEISPSPENPQPEKKKKKKKKIFQKPQDKITISPGDFIVHTYFFASVFHKLVNS